jgi:hypothetical protein
MATQPPLKPDRINPLSPPETPQRPGTDPMPGQPDEFGPGEPDPDQPGETPQEVPPEL